LLQLGLRRAAINPRESGASWITEAGEAPASVSPAVDDHFGSYRLLATLGEGGMGTVYLAEQDRPIRRRVALKAIKLGLNTHEVVARFESERQALALMDHPNIAQVYDAGTSERGRPYFVMEYVPGIRVTEYCDQNRLTTRHRLKLFLKICEGVHHAHQKGVIHRDIKPSNVLVMERDGEVVPKIIDFGLAKAVQKNLAEETLFTQAGVLIGTPEYMSPEQATAGAVDIDTRSDIYSLGLLLYELLVGAMPFDARELRRAGYDEIRRVIRQEDAPRPSARLEKLGPAATEIAERRDTDARSLRAQLRGDLEWITMKALEKDRDRRYSAASELAADLERHLRDEPVSAGPVSAFYLARKFVRKNRIKVLAAAAVLICLVAGLTASTAMYFRAERQRGQADRQRAEAQRQHGIAQQQRAEAQRQQAAAEQQRQEAVNQRLRAEEQRAKAQRQELANRRLLYVSDMNLAQRAWDESSIPQMRNLLLRHAPAPQQQDLRGFEWYLLWRLAHSYQASLQHAQSVISLCFSTDGKRMATGCSDGSVKIWDVASGQQIFNVEGRGEVRTLAVSLAEEKLAAVSADGTVRSWNPTTGEESRVATIEGQAGGVRAAAFTPDGRTLVTLSADDTVRISDAASGKEIATSKADPKPVSFGLSSDGRLLVIGSSDGFVSLRSAATGQETRRIKTRSALTVAALSPDGNTLAIGAGYAVYLWDVAKDTQLQLLSGHSELVLYANFSPDGKQLVTGSGDRTARLWDLASPQQVGVSRQVAVFKGHGDAVLRVGFSPDGKSLVTASQDRTAKIWSLESEGAPGLIRQAGDVMAIAPDGKSFAIGMRDGSIKIWTVADKRVLKTLTGHTDMLRLLAFAPDGNTLASASKDGTARLWDLSTGNDLVTLRHGAEVLVVAFSPDGRTLASGSADGALKLWALPAGQAVASIDRRPNAVLGAAFSPDGRLLAISAGYDILLHEVASGRPVAALKGHTFDAYALTFSPDGKLLASTSLDQTVRLWDVASGREVITLAGHSGGTRSVAFSPDGKRLATGSNDRTVKIWEVPAGRELATLRGHLGPVSSVAFSPDGTLLASTGDWTVRQWRAASQQEVAARLPRTDLGPAGSQLGKPSEEVKKAGEQYSDINFGVSFKLPPGWIVRPSARWIDKGEDAMTVNVSDPKELTNTGFLYYRRFRSPGSTAPEDIDRALRENAEKKIEQRRSEGREDYSMPKENCAPRTINGRRGLTCVATYLGYKKPMAEYQTWVRSGNAVALVCLRVPAVKLPQLRKRFDAVSESLRIP
jgi:WD40 repeat protein/serine/threonine protein kinase